MTDSRIEVFERLYNDPEARVVLHQLIDRVFRSRMTREEAFRAVWLTLLVGGSR